MSQDTEEEKKKAKQLFTEGVSYFEAGKHAQALEAFQKSYKLRPHWAIRYNLGLCYKELGMYTKAKSEFLNFLDEGGNKIKQSTKEEVQKELASLDSIIAIIGIEINTTGAQIYMDGKLAGISPLADKIEIDPGSHVLLITHPDYENYQEEFILSKGEKKSFRISLEKKVKGKKEIQTGNENNVKEIQTEQKEKESKTIAGKKGQKTKKAWALPVFITSAVLTAGSIAAGSTMLGLAFNQKSKMDELDRQMKNNEYEGSYQEYLNERNKIADKGKLYSNLILLYSGCAFIVPAIVAVVLGHPFQKEKLQDSTVSSLHFIKSIKPTGIFMGKENFIYVTVNF